jgi:hypothetical protein
MKMSVASLSAVVSLASAFLPTAGYAQAPPPGQPYIQVPIPQIPGFGPPPPRGEQNYDRERWEHCERLRDREHELRDRLAYASPYGEDRARLEHRLREVHYQREQCRGR